jgi:uncharacterized protein
VKAALLALALLLVTSTARAAPTREHPLEDAAKVVPDEDERGLEFELETLRAQGVDLAVIVVNTTGRESIEVYARKRATAWATGDTPAAVLVLAVKDRKSRLEVSDPLRDKFPDARAKSILDNIKGYLRSADYTGAIRAVITEVKNGVGGIAPDTESPHPQVPDPIADQPPEPAVAAPVVEQPAAYTPPPRERNWTPIIYAILGGAALLLIAFLWARSRVASRATLTANHVITSDRGVFLETLWCVLLIFGGILYVVGVIMATSRRSGRSSNGWGSTFTSSGGGSFSSGGGGSSSGGGGWSGGGASSGW